MDRKEERRNSFQRKKEFKKLTRSSKVKTEKKKTKRNQDDFLYMEEIVQSGTEEWDRY
jgi:hypothetical protein